MIDIPSTALSVIPPTHFREIAIDDRKVVAVSLLLMFANAYYKQLECAVRLPCSELDMKFNQRYLWVVKHIRHLLLKHPDLADFPLRFHPVFADLNPSTVRDVDWEEIVAPDVERFISSIQSYAVEHGIHDLDEDSPAWRFLEKFRPGINEAIDTGNEYRKRMELQFHRSRKKTDRENPAGSESSHHESIKRNTDRIPELIEEVRSTPRKTVSMMSGATKRRMKATGAVVEDEFTASQQYKSINWKGKTYTLRPGAAKIIEALHDAQRSLGLPGLAQEEIFSRAYGSDQTKWPSRHPRVQNYFRSGDAKRLWDDGFIDHDGKGNFWLRLGTTANQTQKT